MSRQHFDEFNEPVYTPDTSHEVLYGFMSYVVLIIVVVLAMRFT